MIHFLKNLAMFGGLCYIAAYGAGPISLDARGGGARRENAHIDLRQDDPLQKRRTSA